jgi:hypothetical protein
MAETSQHLTQRGGVWHYQRRVPHDYAHLDQRSIIRLSTKIKVTNDRAGTKASRVVARMNETHEAYWSGLAEAKATEAVQSYTNAVKRARSLDLDYQQPSVWAQQPIIDVLARIEALIAAGPGPGAVENPALRKAVLGGVEKPEIRPSSLYTEYEATQRTKLSKMSPNQQRKWTNARKRAVELLIEKRGDKALHALTRADAVAYADSWEDRVITGEINAGTANKSISHIGGMISAVNKRLRRPAVRDRQPDQESNHARRRYPVHSDRGRGPPGDGAHHRQAEIRRRIRLEAQAEVSSGYCLHLAAGCGSPIAELIQITLRARNGICPAATRSDLALQPFEYRRVDRAVLEDRIADHRESALKALHRDLLVTGFLHRRTHADTKIDPAASYTGCGRARASTRSAHNCLARSITDENRPEPRATDPPMIATKAATSILRHKPKKKLSVTSASHLETLRLRAFCARRRPFLET